MLRLLRQPDMATRILLLRATTASTLSFMLTLATYLSIARILH